VKRIVKVRTSRSELATRKQVSDVAADLANLSQQSTELKSQLLDLQEKLTKSGSEKDKLLNYGGPLNMKDIDCFSVLKSCTSLSEPPKQTWQL
jgi:hypothetical protein